MLQAPGLSLLVPIASLLLLPSEAGASWLAAIRTVDVSPTPEHLSTDDVFLGGYGALGFRDGLTLGYARGVADPIMARALYVQEVVGEAAAGVEQRQSAFVLVVLDAVGVGNRIRDEIRERVTAAVVGLEPERVLVASTHTHCGPDLQGMWGGINDRYRAAVVAGAADAAIFAHGNASRVDLAVSSAETDGALSRNRRGWDFTINSTVVLSLRDAETGVLTGVLANFAAHPTTLGRSVLDASADFGGYLCRHVEGATGAPTIWVNGALGDVSAVGQGGEGFEVPARYGAALGEFVLRALTGRESARPIRHHRPAGQQPALGVAVSAYEQPISNAAFVAALVLGVLDGYYEVVQGTVATIRMEVATIRIGDGLEIVTTPGESLTRNAVPVIDEIQGKVSSPAAMVWGLTQDSVGYFVPSDEWMSGRNGNYEEGVSPGQDAGDILRDTLLAMVGSSVDGSQSSNSSFAARSSGPAAELESSLQHNGSSAPAPVLGAMRALLRLLRTHDNSSSSRSTVARGGSHTGGMGDARAALQRLRTSGSIDRAELASAMALLNGDMT